MKRLPPLNALRAFAVAAQKGSFTRAGEALHVTQGAISRQVKLLEDTLGKPLFFRAHQGIELTGDGRQLAEALHQAFADIESAVERITADQRRRQISINIPPTFATRWLAPRLSEFCRQYPYIDLSITTDWIQNLRDSQAHDCLVVFDLAPWPKAECMRLMLERHVMVSSPRLWRNDHPPALSDAVLLHILNGNARLPVWERWIEKFGLSHVDPRPGLAFSTLDQAINAALSGTGVAIVDETMIHPELESGTLRRVSPSVIDGPYGYWFIDVARDGERKEIVRIIRDWMMQQTAAAGDAPARDEPDASD